MALRPGRPGQRVGNRGHSPDPVGEEERGRERDSLDPGIGAVVGGHEVLADCEAEGQRGARFDLVGVGEVGRELLAQVLHAPVVDGVGRACGLASSAR